MSVRRLGVDGMKWPARPRQDLPGGAVQPGDDIERERERERDNYILQITITLSPP